MLRQNVKRICLFLILVTVTLTGCGDKKKENLPSKNKQSEIITEKPDDDTFEGEIDFSELENDEEEPVNEKQEETQGNTQNHIPSNKVESTENTVIEGGSEDSSEENTNDNQDESVPREKTKDSEGYYNNVVKP